MHKSNIPKYTQYLCTYVVYMHKYKYVCMYVCMYMCGYVCMYMCTCVRMYVYVYAPYERVRMLQGSKSIIRGKYMNSIAIVNSNRTPHRPLRSNIANN